MAQFFCRLHTLHICLENLKNASKILEQSYCVHLKFAYYLVDLV
jgi:hypothetical protein